jgi:hypothetical protein
MLNESFRNKGPRRNNFTELAPRSGSDLIDPIEQNRSNSTHHSLYMAPV